MTSCCWWLFLPSNPVELQEWAQMAANTPSTSTNSNPVSMPQKDDRVGSADELRRNPARNYLTTFR